MFTQPILRHCVPQTDSVKVVCQIAAILTTEHQQKINLQGVLLCSAHKKNISEMIHVKAFESMAKPWNLLFYYPHAGS